MTNPFVHHYPRRATQNRSAVRGRQWLLLVIALAAFATPTLAQNFPDAQKVLANVRLRQSRQQIDLRGQLRQDTTIIPFRLVQNGPVVRYLFTNPQETLQVRLGANDSRLDEITRSGAERIAAGKLDEPVRQTAITYEDLALKFLYWPNARVIGADFIRTRYCWQLQLQAPASDSQYAGVMLWVDKDSGALMRLEVYDSSGKLVKRFEVVSAQKIEGRWYLKQMRVEAGDPRSVDVTARTYLEINR